MIYTSLKVDLLKSDNKNLCYFVRFKKGINLLTQLEKEVKQGTKLQIKTSNLSSNSFPGNFVQVLRLCRRPFQYVKLWNQPFPAKITDQKTKGILPNFLQWKTQPTVTENQVQHKVFRDVSLLFYYYYNFIIALKFSGFFLESFK